MSWKSLVPTTSGKSKARSADGSSVDAYADKVARYRADLRREAAARGPLFALAYSAPSAVAAAPPAPSRAHALLSAQRAALIEHRDAPPDSMEAARVYAAVLRIAADKRRVWLPEVHAKLAARQTRRRQPRLTSKGGAR